MVTIEQRYTTRSAANCYDVEFIWRMVRVVDTLESALAYVSNLNHCYSYRITENEQVYTIDWVDDDADYCVPVLVKI